MVNFEIVIDIYSEIDLSKADRAITSIDTYEEAAHFIAYPLNVFDIDIIKDLASIPFAQYEYGLIQIDAAVHTLRHGHIDGIDFIKGEKHRVEGFCNAVKTYIYSRLPENVTYVTKYNKRERCLLPHLFYPNTLRYMSSMDMKNTTVFTPMRGRILRGLRQKMSFGIELLEYTANPNVESKACDLIIEP